MKTELTSERGAPDTNVGRICDLNDRFRKTFQGGRVSLSPGVQALSSLMQSVVIFRVSTFSEFTSIDDPCGDHGGGSFEVDGRPLRWKITHHTAGMVLAIALVGES